MAKHQRCFRVLATVALGCLLTAPPAQAATVCQAGQPDDYSNLEGSETALPSSPWAQCLDRSTGGLQGNFDACQIDRFVGHSFALEGCTTDQDSSGTGTVLITLRLQGVNASNSSPGNDYLLLGVNGVTLWGVALNTLQCVRSGGADCAWSRGDTATFVLDLDHLEPAEFTPSGWCTWTGGRTTILASVLSGNAVDVG